MNFHYFAQTLQTLEKTDSRIAMTKILAELFKKTPVNTIDKLCYLLQGRVVPLYNALEFGIAEKMMIRAIAKGVLVEESKAKLVFKETGDLGKTVEKLKTPFGLSSTWLRTSSQGGQNPKLKTTSKNLKFEEVFKQLHLVAEEKGAGSQEKKIQLLANLISKADPLSARYIVRIPLNKLRLGFSDMTILDSLSWMLKGDKSKRKELEKAYHVRPDLGYIAQAVKENGINGIKHVMPVPGTPILMARANRLASAEDILKKIGKCAIEFKYDGLRLQVHYKRNRIDPSTAVRSTGSQRAQDDKPALKSLAGSSNKPYEIKMFSRNLEDVTEMFPDIERAVLKQIRAESIIFEGEVVAYNPSTNVFVPFQQTMQRKRKYDIEKKAAEIPVKLFVFELLYCNGSSYLQRFYKDRKAQLRKVVKNGSTIIYAQETITDNVLEIEKQFDESNEKHFEGIIAKKIDGVYEAGIRGWNWIKFKKAMSRRLSDSVDVVVMGYTKGQGKRTSFGVGQFLTGVYDKKTDTFVTVSKIGTGLTDAQFKEFISRVKKLSVSKKPSLYNIDKLFTPDVWLEPKLVVEIRCDEITRSSVHTAGRVMQPSKSGKALSVKESGYALRFPRLVRFRDDRRAEGITTVEEIKSMYEKQKS